MLLVARLTSSGGVAEEDLDLTTILDPPEGARWEVVLTTEDAAFAAEPLPPELDASMGSAWCYFHRPGAVIFRATQDG